MPSLYSLAKVLRSKNSGPFEITLDVLFADEETYRYVMDSGALTRESIAALYHIAPEKILVFTSLDSAYGVKITYLRDVPSGTAGDRDVYGAQQHAPLMCMEIPPRKEPL